ncbi:hypothetical protein [Candidatus Methanocrinis natronophilus]|uniref:DUF2203 family protein n=1 Tax=Candidatus Methanocrinis natronophilus TaxID=3033396 RepID=A0ABT5XAR4_9EURY|nr:hypothetical protein [Candidatus Methanocrinis natronophilus]MDF0591783.1 hypothetical protein [Candidatus Methanocrinis natronophilus]
MRAISGLDRRLTAMEKEETKTSAPLWDPTDEEWEVIDERVAALPPEIQAEIEWLLDKIGAMVDESGEPISWEDAIDRLTADELEVMDIFLSRLTGQPSMLEAIGLTLLPVVRRPRSETIWWGERRSIIDLDGWSEGGWIPDSLRPYRQSEQTPAPSGEDR